VSFSKENTPQLRLVEPRSLIDLAVRAIDYVSFHSFLFSVQQPARMF